MGDFLPISTFFYEIWVKNRPFSCFDGMLRILYFKSHYVVCSIQKFQRCYLQILLDCLDMKIGDL